MLAGEIMFEQVRDISNSQNWSNKTIFHSGFWMTKMWSNLTHWNQVSMFWTPSYCCMKKSTGKAPFSQLQVKLKTIVGGARTTRFWLPCFYLFWKMSRFSQLFSNGASLRPMLHYFVKAKPWETYLVPGPPTIYFYTILENVDGTTSSSPVIRQS